MSFGGGEVDESTFGEQVNAPVVFEDVFIDVISDVFVCLFGAKKSQKVRKSERHNYDFLTY